MLDKSSIDRVKPDMHSVAQANSPRWWRSIPGRLSVATAVLMLFMAVTGVLVSWVQIELLTRPLPSQGAGQTAVDVYRAIQGQGSEDRDRTIETLSTQTRVIRLQDSPPEGQYNDVYLHHTQYQHLVRCLL